MIRRLAVALVMATAVGSALGGCSTSCPLALQPGVLVAQGPATLGLRVGNGKVFDIRWPLGVGVRLDDGRLAVADAFGSVIAREGDAVSLPGGTMDNETWGVCGDVQVDGRQLP